MKLADAVAREELTGSGEDNEASTVKARTNVLARSFPLGAWGISGSGGASSGV